MTIRNDVVYLDNAATTWPKPGCVIRAMTRFAEEIGANPGRSGHRMSVEAGRIVYQAREAVAELFNAPDPLRVVFGSNATEAINLALCGLLRSGDHVITSSIEHNSMMRPLRELEREGVQVTVVGCSPEGLLDPADVEAAVRPDTRMIALNHASNVMGTLLPVAEVGAIAHRHDLLLLADAAQTAGTYRIDVPADKIDLLAFSGHKSLFGPTGTGGLIIGDRVDVSRLRPIKRGGTGSRSESEQQPDFLPDLCESGTPNVMGLAGLEAGIRWLKDREVDEIRWYETKLTGQLILGLKDIPGVEIHGCLDPERQTSTISFNVRGRQPSEVAARLDEEFGIMCRPGLHCAPMCHKTMGTFPAGTVRFSLGVFNTSKQVETALKAVRQIAGDAK